MHSNTMRLAGFKTILPYYSLLEMENSDARGEATLGASMAEGDILDLLPESMVYNGLEQGFIILSKDDKQGPFEYVDFGIKLHVLNEKRFRLAFPHIPVFSGPVDLTKVNSILRPTIPEGDVWFIRTPW